MSQTTVSRPLDPTTYMRDLFRSKAVRDGAVIRRKSRDIDRLIGRDQILDEVRRRGFRAVENAGQIIVFCNAEPIRPLT